MIEAAAMAWTGEPEGGRVALPTAPVEGVNLPSPTESPTEGEASEDADSVKDAERIPDDPDRAAEDGLA